MGISADCALQKLKEGNAQYIKCNAFCGDASQSKREQTSKNGQVPYAIVITCSDSRVIPEAVFSAGLGDLFVIRVAGNVIGPHELGSIEYAVEHLYCKLAIVLGHTDCGAVSACCSGEGGHFVKSITDEIRNAIGGERDVFKACILNVRQSAAKIKSSISFDGFEVVCALYDIEIGKVDFDI